MANDFVDDLDITHTLLWDESFQSWAELGVSLQPSANLYAADGTLLRQWLGPFDEDEVLQLIAGDEVARTDSSATTAEFCRFTDRFARAQRDAVAYPAGTLEARQRILDDLRYAANAMAQTAPSDITEPIQLLADAVRSHSRALLDAGLDVDPVDVTGLSPTADNLTDAIGEAGGVTVDRCDVTLEPNAAP